MNAAHPAYDDLGRSLRTLINQLTKEGQEWSASGAEALEKIRALAKRYIRKFPGNLTADEITEVSDEVLIELIMTCPDFYSDPVAHFLSTIDRIRKRYQRSWSRVVRAPDFVLERISASRALNTEWIYLRELEVAVRDAVPIAIRRLPARYRLFVIQEYAPSGVYSPKPCRISSAEGRARLRALDSFKHHLWLALRRVDSSGNMARDVREIDHKGRFSLLLEKSGIHWSRLSGVIDSTDRELDF